MLLPLPMLPSRAEEAAGTMRLLVVPVIARDAADRPPLALCIITRAPILAASRADTGAMAVADVVLGSAMLLALLVVQRSKLP